MGELTIYLIENAPELFDDFEDDGATLPTAITSLHQSTDSGLSEAAATSDSPDSALFDSPPLSDDADGPCPDEIPPTGQTGDSQALVVRPYFSSPKQSGPTTNRPFLWRSTAASQSPSGSPSSPRRLARHFG